MKEIDDLIKKLKELYTPICVKGETYPGNNPYVMNKINNLLHAGKLALDDVVFDKSKIIICDKTNSDEKYLFYPELEKISNDICDEYNEIRQLKREVTA